MDAINKLGGDKTAAILQTTFEIYFVNMLEFRFSFHWQLFYKVLLTNYFQMMF